MNQALREFVMPELKSLGFKGSFPHFRRLRGEVTEMLAFQFNKYGGSFTIEAATLSAQEASAHWKADLSVNKATVYDASNRIRLHSSQPDKWFGFTGESDLKHVAQAALHVIENDGLSFWLRFNPSFHPTGFGGR